MIDNPRPPVGDMISFRLDGALAEQLNRIARKEACSRSELLRRVLLANLDNEDRLTVHWIHRLRAIEGDLSQMHELLEEDEAEDAAAFIKYAVDGVGRAIDELETGAVGDGE